MEEDTGNSRAYVDNFIPTEYTPFRASIIGSPYGMHVLYVLGGGSPIFIITKQVLGGTIGQGTSGELEVRNYHFSTSM